MSTALIVSSSIVILHQRFTEERSIFQLRRRIDPFLINAIGVIPVNNSSVHLDQGYSSCVNKDYLGYLRILIVHSQAALLLTLRALKKQTPVRRYPPSDTFRINFQFRIVQFE